MRNVAHQGLLLEEPFTGQSEDLLLPQFDCDEMRKVYDKNLKCSENLFEHVGLKLPFGEKKQRHKTTKTVPARLYG